MKAFLISALACSAATAADESLKTVAEATGYKETSKYADVVSFYERLAKASPVVRLGEMGVSQEGRKLPLVMLADPPVANADEAKKSGKLVFFVLANIHAGEVDGKDALMAFAREVATGGERGLLKDLVFVFAPIFNADGNEKFAKNRPQQAGPTLVGTRANAMGLDLNRDFVKLETPEARALARALTMWDPAVYMDLHTTNGSYHRYTLTFEGGGSPAGDAKIVTFTREKLLPTVSERMEKGTGYKSTFYGNFDRERTRWETVPPTPRYGTHYVGLRGCVSVLSESYNYSPFPERVAVSKAFVREIAKYAAENRAAIRELVATARAEAMRAPTANDVIALRSKETAVSGPTAILGFVEEVKDGKRKPTATPKEYPVTYMGGSTPTLTVRRPIAYVMPSLPKVVENLRRHGIEVEELTEAYEGEVEAFNVEKVVRGRVFQGHTPTTVEGKYQKEKRRLAEKSVVVRTAQPLSRLAEYLLEPQAADGLVQWNFFDEELKEGGTFPVVRVVEPVALKTVKVAGP